MTVKNIRKTLNLGWAQTHTFMYVWVCVTKLSFLISEENKKKINEERKKTKPRRTGRKIINILFIVFSFSLSFTENVMSMWHNGFVIDLVKKKTTTKTKYINCVFIFIFFFFRHKVKPVGV